jgi:hypothetical protein
MIIAHRDASPLPLPGDLDSEPPALQSDPQVAFQPLPDRRSDAYGDDGGFFQSLGELFGSEKPERRINKNSRHRASTKNPDR